MSVKPAPRSQLWLIELIESVNRTLEVETIPAQYKEGLCECLERVLHANGQYDGFGFLDDENPAPPRGSVFYWQRFYYISSPLLTLQASLKQKQIPVGFEWEWKV